MTKYHKCLVRAFLGCVVFFTSLWGGSYLLHDIESWAFFPTAMSMMLGMFFGTTLFISNMIDADTAKRMEGRK